MRLTVLLKKRMRCSSPANGKAVESVFSQYGILPEKLVVPVLFLIRTVFFQQKSCYMDDSGDRFFIARSFLNQCLWEEAEMSILIMM